MSLSIQRVKKCQNLGKKILCSGDGPPAPPAHTGGTAKIHPKLSSFINYIQVDCVLRIPTIPVLNPRKMQTSYIVFPISLFILPGSMLLLKRTSRIRSRYLMPSVKSSWAMSCMVEETVIPSQCNDGINHKLINVDVMLYMNIFPNQMSSFSENAALGYLKSQVRRTLQYNWPSTSN